jgi:hypothetical protein
MAIPTYKPKILYPWLQKPNEQPSAPPPPAQNVEPVPRFLDSTRRSGLTKGNRHHVHLSPDIQTATRVQPIRKCERQDLNLHGLPHWILSPARLPIPPLSLTLPPRCFRVASLDFIMQTLYSSQSMKESY